MKKPVLGKGADALFEITQATTKEIEEKVLSSKLPKFRTFEHRLTILLKESNLSFLSELEKKIMRSRNPKNKRERITKNSIIRACLDAVSNLSIDTGEIPDEKELLRRIERAINERRA
ncbi:MAG: hypothetical protein AB1630_08130 [bacterium]